MWKTRSPHTLRQPSRVYKPAFSLGPRASSSSFGTSNAKKSLIQQLQSQLSIKIDEASHVMKKVPQILLDAIVDSAFKFTDQALHSSESNFAPVDEIGGSIEILQLEGNIPEDFPEGVYIRNGSNPLFGALQSTASIFGESNDIWVEGEGMLHALYFTKKNSASWSVSYANGYVQSETLKIERDRQKPCFLPAAQGDSAAVISAYILNYLRFGKVNKNISNTNVFEHAGRVYAVAESHQPQEICIQNLETGNTWDIHEQWNRPCTSHPKVAPESRELVIFGSDAKKPFLVVGVISDDGTKLKHKVDLKLDRPTLCHDIGVTIRYNIIMDLPLTVDIGRLTTGGQLIEFEKEGYARIGVMPRYGDAESVVWFDVEPCCMFHLINCFEEGDEVVVQGLCSADSVIPGPRLSKSDILPEKSQLTGDGKTTKQRINEKLFSRLYEWRLNQETKTITGEYLTGRECSLELPMINNHYTGLHHSYAYAQIVDSVTRSGEGCGKVLPKYGGFAKLCLDERGTGTETSTKDLIKMEIHRLGEDQFCSGASFVPRVCGSHEDDGWIISFVHDEVTNTSQVHIIDTQRFEGAPVAKITLPHRVPYGFHGTFVHSKITEHANNK
uniref:Uncharacterized protein n=1 Tax=Hordeum vulgare subsp. vulgare TaxID=112509 RepID=A0A8I6WPC1_HORVV